jgi:hypothetical protein
MRYVGLLEHVGKMRKAYKILVGKESERERLFGIPRQTWGQY